MSSGKDKTSLILAVPNRAGAVYDMLAPMAANGVSMTRFESRPARTGQWEYYFYVDVLGHRDDANVARTGGIAGAGGLLQGAGFVSGAIGPRRG
ncbi:ACT domain-containing protein [Bordetella pertussis]|uniref:ACT domain-containing protein n=1 Tax=Bordetella pertussis TaxID=520 RepID=UPI0030030FF3